MKKILLMLVVFSSCEKTPEQKPSKYWLDLETPYWRFHLSTTATDDQLYFEVDNFQMHAVYKDGDAYGIHNDTSFTIRDSFMFICNGEQNVPVVMSIEKVN